MQHLVLARFDDDFLQLGRQFGKEHGVGRDFRELLFLETKITERHREVGRRDVRQPSAAVGHADGTSGAVEDRRARQRCARCRIRDHNRFSTPQGGEGKQQGKDECQ